MANAFLVLKPGRKCWTLHEKIILNPCNIIAVTFMKKRGILR
jgi:hypothetical protein